jgi:hypothetical protein
MVVEELLAVPVWLMDDPGIAQLFELALAQSSKS